MIYAVAQDVSLLQLAGALALVAVAIIGAVGKLLEVRMTRGKNEIIEKNTTEHDATLASNNATQRLVVNAVNTLTAGQEDIVSRLAVQDEQAEQRHNAWLTDRVEIFRRLPPETTGEVPVTMVAGE
jgi:hypothetical protein